MPKNSASSARGSPAARAKAANPARTVSCSVGDRRPRTAEISAPHVGLLVHVAVRRGAFGDGAGAGAGVKIRVVVRRHLLQQTSGGFAFLKCAVEVVGFATA